MYHLSKEHLCYLVKIASAHFKRLFEDAIEAPVIFILQAASPLNRLRLCRRIFFTIRASFESGRSPMETLREKFRMQAA